MLMKRWNFRNLIADAEFNQSIHQFDDDRYQDE